MSTRNLRACLLMLAIAAIFAIDQPPSVDAGTAQFVVNRTDDAVDPVVGNGLCDVNLVLLGSQCSLRAAIQEANAAAGTQTISFNISGAGAHTITLTGPLPAITEGVIIDGYTQAGSVANTNDTDNGLNTQLMVFVDAHNLGLFDDALTINANQAEIRGLAIGGGGDAAIAINGNNNTVHGNFLGTNLTGDATTGVDEAVSITFGESNNIGGPNPEDRNLLTGDTSGAYLVGPGVSANIVAGNLIGTDRTGTVGLAPFANGVAISLGASFNNIGAANPGYRNVISGNGNGIQIATTEAIQNYVRSNYIGTAPDGTTAVPNRVGVFLFGSNQNLIGGLDQLSTDACTGSCNVIAGNSTHGMVLGNAGEPDGGQGNQIVANYIGLDKNRGPLGNGGDGIRIGPGVAETLMGGVTNPNYANVVAHNGGAGIVLGNTSGLQNQILINEIYDNAGLGIDISTTDLSPDGVTANDDDDADAGGNDTQNYPQLVKAETGSTVVDGFIDTKPNVEVSLNFYYTDGCDSSGYGEGQHFIGTQMVTTDGAGHNDFHLDVPAPVAPVGSFVTATAMVDKNTSEFSNCVFVTTPGGATPTPSPVPSITPTPTPTASPTPSPTPTPTVETLAWGDVLCDGQPGIEDVRAVLRAAAFVQAQATPAPACPIMGDIFEFEPPVGSQKWGDNDCDSDIDGADALPILLHIVDLPSGISPSCPDIGESVALD